MNTADQLSSPPKYPNLPRYQNISLLIITPLMTSHLFHQNLFIPIATANAKIKNCITSQEGNTLQPVGLNKKTKCSIYYILVFCASIFLIYDFNFYQCITFKYQSVLTASVPYHITNSSHFYIVKVLVSENHSL